jgi:hypothetical protein
VFTLVVALLLSQTPSEDAIKQAGQELRKAKENLALAEKGRVRPGARTGVIDNYGEKMWVFSSQKEKDDWIDKLRGRVKQKQRLFDDLKEGGKNAAYLAALKRKLNIDNLNFNDEGMICDPQGNDGLEIVVKRIKDATTAYCWVHYEKVVMGSGKPRLRVERKILWLRIPSTEGLATDTKIKLDKPYKVIGSMLDSYVTFEGAVSRHILQEMKQD